MNLVKAKDLVKDASKNHYAVPALNANGATYDLVRAMIEAAEELRSPLIIQAYEHNLDYRGYDYFPYLVDFLARGTRIPMALQLDHGTNIVSIMKAVRAGFTSIMVDCAQETLEENISRTNRAAALLTPLGISVEAEVGNIIKSSEEEGKSAPTTNVAEVKKFSEEAHVDMLAVAIGTTHGIFEMQTNVDMDLLADIDKVTDIPLVLHGTCGLPYNLVAESVKRGINKVNFGEVFRLNYIKYFNELSRDLDHEGHAWKIMQECKNRLKEDIKEIIKTLGSDGRA